MSKSIHELRYETKDIVYNATVKNCTLQEAKREFTKHLRGMGLLNVDPGQIRKGHRYEGTEEIKEGVERCEGM